jgi:protoporphyrinogen oxidase
MEGKKVVVIGGGLPGLSAAYWLTRQGVDTEVLERGSEVGGLARTLARDGFRFDLGGYRFFSRSPEVQRLLTELLRDDLISVRSSAKIFFRGRLYDYPVNVRDLAAGFGARGTALALWSLAGNRLAAAVRRDEPENLEEWLLAEYGETLFRAFFKPYQEKIWGIPCHRVAADLAKQRLRGLPLTSAVAGAFLPGRLAEPAPRHEFLYPRLGIGQLTDRFAGEIERRGIVRRDAAVAEVRHRRGRVEAVVYKNETEHDSEVAGTDFISSIPLPRLLHLLSPRPPADVLASSRSLLFRDLITVHLEIDRERVTNEPWIYVPDPEIAFARILEPKNWSPAMAPPGRTSIVAEHYCFETDGIWSLPEGELVARTVADLADRMGILKREEVAAGYVGTRIKKVYPVYETGYRDHLVRIQRYLKTLTNFQTVGRGGMFKYYNVTHLVQSGVKAAENVFGAGHDLFGLGSLNGHGASARSLSAVLRSAD